MNQRIVMVRGLPGSGKSTLANNVILSDSVVVEADQFHMINGKYEYNVKLMFDAHQWCQAQVTYWLNQGKTVYVANTSITARAMCPYYEMSRSYDVGFEIHNCLEHYGDVHNVPKEVYDRMKQKWEYYTTESFIEYYKRVYEISFDTECKE